MPNLNHCIDCEKPVANSNNNICDCCLEDLSEPTTADEHNAKPHYRVYETMLSKEPIAIGYWDFERKALINVETGRTIPDYTYLVTERMNGNN